MTEPLEPVPDAVVAMLADPAAHPHRPARVEHVQTHISHVFLAGPWVYKLKKAVRFAFLDFGTAARRRHFCEEELRLNRRLAAPVYVDVPSVVRTADGEIALGGVGEPVEAVLRMRRLPADRMLPALLAADAVDAAMMAALAQRIADFHRDAPSGPEIAAEAAPDALRARWDDTLGSLAPFVGRGIDPDAHAFLRHFGARFVAEHGPLLRARQAEHRIREGHGDLHAEHVCFVAAAPASDAAPADVVPASGTAPAPRIAAASSGAPAESAALPPGIYVFDCIEFSRPFRCNDVASEVAFLAMDLERRGRRDLADAFAAAYVAATGDATLPRLVPYYAAARACVRALVACLTSDEPEVDAVERAAARDRADAYLRLAARCAWRAGDPAVVVCCGLSGTGKSALASALADATDFVWLRSDAIRRATPRPEPPASRYTAAAREAVYERLAEEADRALAAGRGVVADATFIRRADRDRLAAVAARHGRRWIFLETTAPEAVVRARLAARTPDDVSEARLDTHLAQRAARDPLAPEEPHRAIPTDGPLEAARGAALAALWRWRTADG